MKRILAIVLTLLMMTGSIGFALELSQPGELPLTSEDITLTIGFSQSPLTTDYEENYATQLIEQETGIKLDFVLFPSDSTETLQKFALMVSSGQKLPDIFAMVEMSDIIRYSYGASGVFLPLNEYFESGAYYWNQSMDKYADPEAKENYLKYITSSDGNIYCYPAYAIDVGDLTALGVWINKTWLDNLNLAVPTTTEELYEALAAFRDNDANGNGDLNDEIPLIGHKDWMGSVSLMLMNSFVYDAFDGWFNYQLNVEDGVLYAPFVTDAYREGLRYMRTLCEEGLLSPLSFSMTSSELSAINSIPNDQATLVGAFVGHPATVFSADGTVERVKEYMGLPAMIGPEGVQWTPYTGELTYYSAHITKDAEYPELAFRFMDAIAREDLSLSMRFGEQDVDWRYVDEGEANHKYLGYSPIFSVTNDPWITENNKIWHANYFLIAPPKLTGGMVSNPVSELYDYQLDTLWYSTVPLRYSNHPEDVVIKLVFTQEEMDAVGEIETALRSYVDESLARFILGDMDVENDWDNYLSSLDSMGLKRYLETAQQAYDRMNAQ